MSRAASTPYIMIAALGLAWATALPAWAEDLPLVKVEEAGRPPMIKLGPSPDDCPNAGCIDRDMIRRAIKVQSPKFRRCYERALQQDPRVQGKAIARFSIEPDGTISEATLVRSDLQVAGFQECMVQALSGMRFPKRDQATGKVTITYPFHFQPEP